MKTISVDTVVSQLSNYCLPHLTTLIIITGENSLPKPSVFSQLFQYNSFPCLNEIRILTKKNYECYYDYYCRQPRYVDIDKVIFGVEYEKNAVMHLDNYYTCTSYVYTCKSDNRLANIPSGPFRFMYNNTVVAFKTESFAMEAFVNSIIEVIHLFLIHL